MYGNVQDSPNKVGIMSSKLTGEPPLLTSVSVLTAFQAALTSAKQGLLEMQASILKTNRDSELVATNGCTESVQEQGAEAAASPRDSERSQEGDWRAAPVTAAAGN